MSWPPCSGNEGQRPIKVVDAVRQVKRGGYGLGTGCAGPPHPRPPLMSWRDRRIGRPGSGVRPPLPSHGPVGGSPSALWVPARRPTPVTPPPIVVVAAHSLGGGGGRAPRPHRIARERGREVGPAALWRRHLPPSPLYPLYPLPLLCPHRRPRKCNRREARVQTLQRRTETRQRRPPTMTPSRPCHCRRSGRGRGGWGSDAPCRPHVTRTGPRRASHAGGTGGCGIAAPGTTRGTLDWCQRREVRGSAHCLGWAACAR